jgi:hypothetical protein
MLEVSGALFVVEFYCLATERWVGRWLFLYRHQLRYADVSSWQCSETPSHGRMTEKRISV